MRLAQQLLALICLVLLFVFCVSNGELITVRFLTWMSPELPVFLLLIFAFLIGVVLTMLWQSLRAVTRLERKRESAKQSGNIKTRFEKTSDVESEMSESVPVESQGEK